MKGTRPRPRFIRFSFLSAACRQKLVINKLPVEKRRAVYNGICRHRRLVVIAADIQYFVITFDWSVGEMGKVIHYLYICR